MSESQQALDQMLDALRDGGVRITRQRRAILTAISHADDHPDATELHERARKIDDTVSLATVYRTLSALEEHGAVQKHAFEGASARFETTHVEHHDHLIDVDTGDVIEFHDPDIEALQEKIAERYGYKLVFHRLELYGRKVAKKN